MTQEASGVPWDDYIELGLCWRWDGLAYWRCDTCNRCMCPDHTTVEAQLWDTHGMDGVDIRCPAHSSPVGTVSII